MVVDIPNYFTLAIEIGVAFLILWVDRRSRRREQEALQRAYKMDQKHRETQAGKICKNHGGRGI